jgi:hypothetical protein
MEAIDAAVAAALGVSLPKGPSTQKATRHEILRRRYAGEAFLLACVGMSHVLIGLQVNMPHCHWPSRRNQRYKFSSSGAKRDAAYHGEWLDGKMDGFGTMRYADQVCGAPVSLRNSLAVPCLVDAWNAFALLLRPEYAPQVQQVSL